MMAAERTPSRRKQCIFRRTFQRFPFGKCERRSSSSSSSSYGEYDLGGSHGPWHATSTDINHADKSQYPPEKWSPTGSAISTLNVHQPVHGEGLDSGFSRRTRPPSAEPPNTFNGMFEDNVVLDPILGMDHVSNPGFFAPHHLPQHHMNSMTVSLNTMGQQDKDSAYSSVSRTENPHQAVSPPSPSTSSMEMDVGVDPETGERAME